MSALFRIRLVAMLWKETLDGSPGVWAIASSTLPAQQNTSNIQRSGEWPLTIHYYGGLVSWRRQGDVLSSFKFLQLTMPTLHRWKVAWFDKLGIGDIFPLDQPAPLLQELHIHFQLPALPDAERYIFCGQLPNIKHLDLEGVSLPESPVSVCGLRFLDLRRTLGRAIAMNRLLETVEGNPDLEDLSLTNLDLQMPATLSTKAAIILDRLQSFRLRDLKGEETDYLLRHIQAPHCVQFHLSVAISTPGFDASSILDTALQAFEPVLQKIHRTTGASSLDIEGGGIAWSVGQSAPAGPIRRPFIHLGVEGTSFLSSLRWATRVVEPHSSSRARGALYFDSSTSLENAEIVSLLRNLRSVTALWAIRSGGDLGILFRLLGGDGSEPLFPRLNELHLRPWKWEPKALLEAARGRFARPTSTQCCPLAVKIQRGKSHHLILGPRVDLDDDYLKEIRSVEEVTVELASE
ncbi:hypothetical protein FRC00_009018 [Tulasnella sp. 408]|nr:hypothetical protein FRC00_009018 [Tulasnella sp. 408]